MQELRNRDELWDNTPVSVNSPRISRVAGFDPHDCRGCYSNLQSLYNFNRRQDKMIRFASLLIIMVMLCGCTSITPDTISIENTVVNDTVNLTELEDAIENPPTLVPPSNITPVITQTTNVSPTPTKVTTTAPTTQPTGLPITVRTRAPRLLPIPNVSETMNATSPYLHYTDSDFSVDYPSNWSYDSTTILTERNLLTVDMDLDQTSRQVIFGGSNSSTYFSVVTTDIAIGGSENLDTSYKSYVNLIEEQYGAPESAIRNFDFKLLKYDAPVVNFEVILPQSSRYQRYSFMERNFISWNHYYTIRFVTPDDIDNYFNITQTMFKTIQTEERNGVTA